MAPSCVQSVVQFPTKGEVTGLVVMLVTQGQLVAIQLSCSVVTHLVSKPLTKPRLHFPSLVLVCSRQDMAKNLIAASRSPLVSGMK